MSERESELYRKNPLLNRYKAVFPFDRVGDPYSLLWSWSSAHELVLLRRRCQSLQKSFRAKGTVALPCGASSAAVFSCGLVFLHSTDRLRFGSLDGHAVFRRFLQNFDLYAVESDLVAIYFFVTGF